MFSVGEGKRFEVVQFGSSKRKKSGFKYMADEGWVKCKRESISKNEKNVFWLRGFTEEKNGFLVQKLRILKILNLLIKHDFHEQKFPQNNEIAIMP